MRAIAESGQWALLLVLLVSQIGLYRKLAGDYLEDRGGLVARSGPAIGRKLPRRLLTQVRAAGAELPQWVAFVSEGCSGCRRLLGSLQGDSIRHEVAIVVREPSPKFASSLKEAGLSFVAIPSETWTELRIHATPFLVSLDARGVVVDKTIDHRIPRPGELESVG